MKVQRISPIFQVCSLLSQAIEQRKKDVVVSCDSRTLFVILFLLKKGFLSRVITREVDFTHGFITLVIYPRYNSSGKPSFRRIVCRLGVYKQIFTCLQLYKTQKQNVIELLLTSAGILTTVDAQKKGLGGELFVSIEL